MKQIPMVIAALLLATCLATFGLELYVENSDPRYYLPKRPIMSLSKEERESFVAKLRRDVGGEFDTRDPQQVVAELARNGIDAVEQVSLPAFDATAIPQDVPLMPLSGFSNRPTVVCNQNGKYLIYTSDMYGFHNPEGMWSTTNAVEIVAVGNSLTLGYCVPSDRNFVAGIRRSRPQTVNLGMPGEGPLQVLGLLKEYGEALKPKIVIWFYPEANNFAELEREQETKFLQRYLSKQFSQGLRSRQDAVDQAHTKRLAAITKPGIRKSKPLPQAAAKDKFIAVLKLSALRQAFARNLGSVPNEMVFDPLSEVEAAQLSSKLRVFRTVVGEMKSRIDVWGGQLLFVYLPSWERYAGYPILGVKARKDVLTSLADFNVRVVDLHPVFRTHHDPLALFPFGGPGHYNEQGHSLVSDAVLRSLGSSLLTDVANPNPRYH